MFGLNIFIRFFIYIHNTIYSYINLRMETEADSAYLVPLHMFGKEPFIRLTVRVFRGRWSNFERVLLSLLILRVDCGM